MTKNLKDDMLLSKTKSQTSTTVKKETTMSETETLSIMKSQKKRNTEVRNTAQIESNSSSTEYRISVSK